MKKARKFLLNTLILTATSLFLRTLGMGFSVYISNKIGAEGMGIYQLLLSIYSFGVTLSLAGVSLATTRLVTEQLTRSSAQGVRRAVFRCFLYSLIGSLLAACLLFLGAEPITSAWFHGKISSLPLRLLALSLPFMAGAAAYSGYFTAVRRVAKGAAAQVLEQLSHMGITVALFTWIAPQGLEPACLALVIGGALSEVCSFFCLLILYRLDRRRLTGSAPANGPALHQILSICLPVGLSSLVRSAINTAKQVMVPLGLERYGLSCQTALAQYGLIRGMAMPILQFPSALLASFSALLIPELAEDHIQGRRGHIRYIVTRIFRLSLLFSIGVCGILLFYAQDISLAIYQDPQVAHFLRILSPIVMIMYLDDIVDAMLKAMDKQSHLARINIAEALLSLGLLALLLPSTGIYGYLLCLFFSEIFNGTLSIRCLQDTAGFSLQWKKWILGPALCMACSCFTIHLLIPASFIPAILFTGLFYIFLLFLTGHLTREDLRV